MTIFKAWAPPLGLGWGKWIKIYTHTGRIGFKVSFTSESKAKSTFDIEEKYAQKTCRSNKYNFYV